MALILQIVALIALFGHPGSLTRAEQRPQPPIYVIQDKPQQSSQPKQWNNQKLTARQEFMSARSAKRAKQMMYSSDDDYYHSNRYAGFNTAETDLEQYHHQPVKGISHNAELPWYSQAAAVRQSGTKSRQSGLKGGSTKGVSTGRSPASRGRQQPVAAAASPSDAAFASNGTEIRRGSSKKNLVCYYGTWAVYRPDAGKYPVENIDPFLCTHIIYGFTGLSYDNLIKPLDPWNDLEDNYGKGAMKRFTNLKRINPDLKTLVAIGGWNEGSIKYSKMASEPEARSRFVKSVVDFLDKYNFDGLDLDWEYPGARGGHSYDKQNFVKLLRELKQAFEPSGYLLTAAVSAGKWFIDPAYDIQQVSKYLDLINLMAYDYHGGWESKTGMNAPLFHSPKHDLKEERLLNVNWSVNYWLQQGAPAEKIMLGVGSYGRSFTLDKANVNGINAPANQKGQAGPYTREPGSLGYNEICESFQRQPGAWTVVRDPDYLAPYAYNERQWVGYDDMESLALKTQYAKSMGLGGMMMWSIETDDFHGRCHNEKYPLLNTIKRVMNGQARPIQPAPSSTTTTSTTTRRPGGQTTTQPGSNVRPTTSRRPATPTTPGREVEEEARPVSSTRKPAASSTRKPATSITTSTRRPLTTVKPGRPIRPTTSQQPRPTSQPSGNNNNNEFVCRSDGMFGDPKNCRKFIRCVSSGASSPQHYIIYRFDCGPGTAFNEQQQYCDHIYNVPNCAQTNQLQSYPTLLTNYAAHSSLILPRREHPNTNYHHHYY